MLLWTVGVKFNIQTEGVASYMCLTGPKDSVLLDTRNKPKIVVIYKHKEEQHCLR